MLSARGVEVAVCMAALASTSIGCGEGHVNAPRGSTEEQQRINLCRCILQELPPPLPGAPEWRVSGEALVESYHHCEQDAAQANPETFRLVVARFAVSWEGDASQVGILPCE